MFFTSDKRIEQAKTAIQYYKQQHGSGPNEMPPAEELKTLRQHQRVIASAVHPETGEIIPRYMRLSGFSLLNVPHVYCMLFVKQSPLFSCANIAYNQTL